MAAFAWCISLRVSSFKAFLPSHDLSALGGGKANPLFASTLWALYVFPARSFLFSLEAFCMVAVSGRTRLRSGVGLCYFLHFFCYFILS